MSRNQLLSGVGASPGLSWVTGSKSMIQACRHGPRRLRPLSFPLYSMLVYLYCPQHFHWAVSVEMALYSARTVLTQGDYHLKQTLVSLTKRDSIYSLWPHARLIPSDSVVRLNWHWNDTWVNWDQKRRVVTHANLTSQVLNAWWAQSSSK